MRKTLALGFLGLFAISILFTSCNKYEEGNNYSLYSAKMRITGNWRRTAVVINGNDYTNNYPTYTTSIKKDNTYTMNTTVLGYPYNDNGTWEFNGDKTKISFIDSDGDVMTYTIVELRNTIFKLKETIDSDEYVYTFQPQ